MHDVFSIYQMPHVQHIHVRTSAPLYQLGCDDDLVMVTKKQLRGFWGLGDPQEPNSDRYKTGGEKVNF